MHPPPPRTGLAPPDRAGLAARGLDDGALLGIGFGIVVFFRWLGG